MERIEHAPVILPALGLQGAVDLLHTLQADHGAAVIGHDVDPDGTITFDLRLDGRALRSIRRRYRMALVDRNAAEAARQRAWTEQVRSHTGRIEALTDMFLNGA